MSSALTSGSRCIHEHVVFPFWGIVRRQRGHVAYSPAAEGIPRARGRFHPAAPPSALVRGIELAARSSAEFGSPTRGCREADPPHSTDTVPPHPPFQSAAPAPPPFSSRRGPALLFAPPSAACAVRPSCRELALPSRRELAQPARHVLAPPLSRRELALPSRHVLAPPLSHRGLALPSHRGLALQPCCGLALQPRHGHPPRRRRRADSEESKSTICSSPKYAFHTFSKTECSLFVS